MSPTALGDDGADLSGTDSLSTRHLVAIAARMVREVAELARKAELAKQPLATLAIDTELRFASAADRARFTDELSRAVTKLAAKYHDESTSGGRWHRLIVASHLRPPPPSRYGKQAPPDRGSRRGTCPTRSRSERALSAMAASFGPGPEMQVTGRVATWEPPRRVLFDGGEGTGGLAFEWLIESRDGGSCVVRLVNTGFGEGDSWDEQFDGMSEGWKMFLINLQLHLEHFAGRQATAMLPTAIWAGPSSV